MSGAGTWMKAARYHALPQIVMPWVLGTLVALAHGHFNAMLSIITLAGLICAHLGTNLLDDFFDFGAGSPFLREDLESRGVRARLGKCKYVVDGTLSIAQVFLMAAALFTMAFGICLYLTWVAGWPVLVISVVAAGLSFFYSAPPLRLSYNGLGELVVGFTMGTMTVAGTYYVLAGEFTPEPILASVPIAVLIANVLFVHSLMDLDADRAHGKVTLAVALGTRERAFKVMPLEMGVVYGTIVVAVVLGYLPPALLLSLLSLPMAIGLIRSVGEFIVDPDQEPERKPWMGPMDHWEELKQAGLGWFMLRWYMARNLLTLTTLLILVAWLLELGLQALSAA